MIIKDYNMKDRKGKKERKKGDKLIEKEQNIQNCM